MFSILFRGSILTNSFVCFCCHLSNPVSVPFRGFLQTRMHHENIRLRHISVSVPFRGSILTNAKTQRLTGSIFPGFRPLPGFYSYKRKNAKTYRVNIPRFPSPPGVLFLQTVYMTSRFCIQTSFRPLPGFYSYKLKDPKLTDRKVGTVSVPFRGSILTNSSWSLYSSSIYSFRPLPGFYSYKRVTVLHACKRCFVSVPFRGSILTNRIIMDDIHKRK